jgi:hypothetical protein
VELVEGETVSVKEASAREINRVARVARINNGSIDNRLRPLPRTEKTPTLYLAAAEKLPLADSSVDIFITSPP